MPVFCKRAGKNLRFLYEQCAALPLELFNFLFNEFFAHAELLRQARAAHKLSGATVNELLRGANIIKFQRFPALHTNIHLSHSMAKGLPS